MRPEHLTKLLGLMLVSLFGKGAWLKRTLLKSNQFPPAFVVTWSKVLHSSAHRSNKSRRTEVSHRLDAAVLSSKCRPRLKLDVEAVVGFHHHGHIQVFQLLPRRNAEHPETSQDSCQHCLHLHHGVPAKNILRQKQLVQE